jgi:hypothetical protein
LNAAKKEVVRDGATCRTRCSQIEEPTDERKWLLASIAPTEELLEVCVIDNNGDVHPFMFPCFKNEIEWVDPLSGNRMDIQPTHWRKLSLPVF